MKNSLLFLCINVFVFLNLVRPVAAQSYVGIVLGVLNGASGVESLHSVAGQVIVVGGSVVWLPLNSTSAMLRRHLCSSRARADGFGATDFPGG
jgi:hypothetical protein